MNSEHDHNSSNLNLELEMDSGDQISIDSELAEKETEKAKKQRKQFFYWLRFILFWLIIGILFSQFILQRNTVYGESMVPTLYSRDELLVEKVSRFFGGISRGDIVTCKSHLGNSEQDTNIVKRVIGIPGDHIVIKDGCVYIDNHLLTEEYLDPEVTTSAFSDAFQDVLLADDEYYVMGDNRSHSQDSRFFGPVKKKDITGEVLIRFYPFSRFGKP